jgi:NADH:ubiquinone oxidoreductase subunit B-like Fe-S oxidoreductase
MATTWNVVVRKEDEENPVRLYCPTCWETAQEVIANFLKTMEENNES